MPPVKLILSMPGWPTSAAPVPAPPTTTLSTPGGSARFERELRESEHAEGGDLRRLGDDGVSRGERGTALLAHPHHRAVPGWDARRSTPYGSAADLGLSFRPPR